MLNGDRAALRRVGNSPTDWNGVFQQILSAPKAMNDAEKRLVELLVQTKTWATLQRWMSSAWKVHPEVVALLRAHGLTDTEVRTLTVQAGVQAGAPAGYVLAADDKELRAVITASNGNWGLVGLAEALARQQPERAARFVADLWKADAYWQSSLAKTLLKHADRTCREPLVARLKAAREPLERWTLASALAAHAPKAFKTQAATEARAILADPALGNLHSIVISGYAVCGEAVIPDIVACCARWLKPPDKSWDPPGGKGLIVTEALTALGRKALPVALETLSVGVDSFERQRALPFLWKHASKEHMPLVHRATAEGMAHANGWTAATYAEMLPKDPSPLANELWQMLGHSQKPARDAAVIALTRLGEKAIPTAAELLQDKRPKVRQAAVALLSALGSGATAVLLKHAKAEISDQVRDAILHTLEKSGVALPSAPGNLAERVAAMPKLKKPLARRLDVTKLPAVKLKTGQAVDVDTVRWVLWRQSRTKEMRLDVEAGPLVEQFAANGDFGLALVQAFLAGGGMPNEKWLLLLGGVLGDDRIVPLLAPRLREWADKGYWKQAQFAIEGLARIGSEQALSLLDAMSIRLRGKRPQLAQAASEALGEAARRHGLDRDELTDRMVPWLGFERGVTRVVDVGKRRLVVDVGIDWKSEFRDEATGKRVAALPKGAPAAVTREMKELAASLREMSKAQVGRFEDQMVRQRRWTPAAWRGLFLDHPLLRPFGVRLIFGYWKSETLVATFRALEDRTLTNAEDSAFNLGEKGTVGIVHPLELSDEVRAAWVQHTNDHEITPPFPQLGRLVVRVQAKEKTATSKRLSAELVGLTFRSRAEKRGWSRGSVGDAAMVHTYWKAFATAGVDAFLQIDGLQAFADPFDEAALQWISFVRHGSVSIYNFEDDGLGGSRDKRLIRFGDVPPIVYSEVMADVMAMGG